MTARIISRFFIASIFFAQIFLTSKIIGMAPEEDSSPHFSGKINFTYLDLIDRTIFFDPIYFRNRVVRPIQNNEELIYSILPPPTQEHSGLPGYDGQRCIIDIESALKLSEIQKELQEQGLSLKVFDAYRPQSAVNYKTDWKLTPEDPIVKKYHHPRVAKVDLGRLSYMATRSGHTRGVAVDVTIINESFVGSNTPPEDFLGIWDPKELDMGNVGFLAFDERSGHEYSELTDIQLKNRQLLLGLMEGRGYQRLRTEFWHYFYKRERNTDTYYNFPIRDDYLVREDCTLVLPEKNIFSFGSVG